jgi:hypothetical protein
MLDGDPRPVGLEVLGGHSAMAFLSGGFAAEEDNALRKLLPL